MNINKKAIKIVGVIAILLVTSGFFGVKKPTIKYDRVDVKEVGFTDTKMDFVFKVDNPNGFGLDNLNMDWELYISKMDKPAATGKDMKFNIKPNSKTELKLPVEVNYVNIFGSTAELTKIILSGQKEVPFKMKAKFRLDLAILKINIPVETEGKLPLPKVEVKLPLQGLKLSF